MKLTKTLNTLGLLTLLALSTVSCGRDELFGDNGGGNNNPVPPTRRTYQNPGQLLGPDMVDLRRAKNFVILAKAAITTVPDSVITGDLGISPAAASDMQNFSLIADPSNEFATSSQVTGRIYASDYAVPAPDTLRLSVLDMEAAYIDAVGRPDPDFVELHTGDIRGQTLVPGLYKWGGTVLINSDVYLTGGANDVFIFQIGGGIALGTGVKIILQGAINPKNIFWATADAVSLEVGSTFKGIILGQTSIAVKTGAVVDGRLLAQTAVTLDQATVTKPD